MPSVKGILVTCDRCGTSCFSKLLERGDTDGGYTTYDIYEPSPSEWMYVSQIGNLCPDCSKKFKTFIKEFMGDKPISPSWRLEAENGEST